MKTILITLLAATAFWQVNAAESTWLTDLPKAQAQAKAENTSVLMDFTGSDWCSWCIECKKEGLGATGFQDSAAKNVVLVEADFPHKKPQSKHLKKAHDTFKTKYQIQ